MDPSVTVESIIQSSEYIEQFSIKIVNGAHHFPHQEKPEVVNKAIIKFLIGNPANIEKPLPKSVMSSWLGSFSNTVKYGNHVFDVVHKKTNGVASVLPNRVLFLGHTTS